MTPSADFPVARPGLWLILLLIAVGAVLPAGAVPIEHDPNGYNGTAWGSPYSAPLDFVKADENGKVQTFEYRGSRPMLGPVAVESVKTFTIGGQFARVMARYRGKATHAEMLTHLQALYGAIDRTPGLMTHGSGQQFNWRGAETEVNLTYEPVKERGFVFIDSAILAPRFNDNLPEHAY